jgi:hypothetical protein
MNKNLERPHYLGVGKVSSEYSLFINTRRMDHKWNGVQSVVLHFMPFNMTYIKSAHIHLYLFPLPPHLQLTSDTYSAAAHRLSCNSRQLMWNSMIDGLIISECASQNCTTLWWCASGEESKGHMPLWIEDYQNLSHTVDDSGWEITRHITSCMTGHTSYCNIIMMGGQQICKEMASSIRSNRMASKKPWLDTVRGWREEVVVSNLNFCLIFWHYWSYVV